MILPFRISLVVISILFTYFFGETLENFILEVIRFLIPVQESNAIIFNIFHLAAYLIPMLFLGFIITASLGGEQEMKRKVWSIVLAISIGILAFRIYQLWWLLRGGGLETGNQINSWTESQTVSQLYFFERLLPYIIVGALSGLITSLINRDIVNNPYFCICSSLSTFLWLLITHKIQNLSGFSQVSISLIATVTAGFSIGWFFRKIKYIENNPPSST